MREVFLLILIIVGYALCFVAGGWFREMQLLKKLGDQPLKKNREAAVDADSYFVDEPDKGSFAIGYFQGRDEVFNEILDLLDKKERRKRHDRRRKK